MPLSALTFEIPWVFFHETMAQHPTEMWTYTWMQYVDGGDKRYADPDFEVLYAESVACLNAVIASIALYQWYKSGKTNPKCVYALMFCAVLHIVRPCLLHQ